MINIIGMLRMFTVYYVVLGMMINSMMIGILVSTFLGMLPTTLLANFGLVPAVATNIMAVTLNTPTEMISLTTGTWFATHIGCERFQRWLSTGNLLFSRQIND